MIKEFLGIDKILAVDSYRLIHKFNSVIIPRLIARPGRECKKGGPKAFRVAEKWSVALNKGMILAS
jgi:hypothetical protein